ncbi:MAG: hypothetical protein ACRD2W_05675 [Acidimicrobiales bacterium]
MVALVAPALAGEANAASDSNGISAGVTGTQGGSTGGGGSTSTGGSTPICTPGSGGEPGPVNWRPVPENLLTADQRDQASKEKGGWYWRFCGENSDVKVGGTGNGASWFPDAPGSGPSVNLSALAREALQRTPLPAPAIRMSPQPPVPQLVGLPTYLWIDPTAWGPRTASASSGGVTSTVTAVPERVVWDMGQGDIVECSGPGRPHAPGMVGTGACTFTYSFSSARSTSSPTKAFTVTATVHWHATWTASGAAGGGDLGTVERRSSVAIEVAEVQTLNANPRANS